MFVQAQNWYYLFVKRKDNGAVPVPAIPIMINNVEPADESLVVNLEPDRTGSNDLSLEVGTGFSFDTFTATAEFAHGVNCNSVTFLPSNMYLYSGWLPKFTITYAKICAHPSFPQSDEQQERGSFLAPMAAGLYDCRRSRAPPMQLQSSQQFHCCCLFQPLLQRSNRCITSSLAPCPMCGDDDNRRLLPRQVPRATASAAAAWTAFPASASPVAPAAAVSPARPAFPAAAPSPAASPAPAGAPSPSLPASADFRRTEPSPTAAVPKATPLPSALAQAAQASAPGAPVPAPSLHAPASAPAPAASASDGTQASPLAARPAAEAAAAAPGPDPPAPAAAAAVTAPAP